MLTCPHEGEVQQRNHQRSLDDLWEPGGLQREGPKQAQVISGQCTCQFILWPGNMVGSMFTTKMGLRKEQAFAGGALSVDCELLCWTVQPPLTGYQTGCCTQSPVQYLPQMAADTSTGKRSFVAMLTFCYLGGHEIWNQLQEANENAPQPQLPEASDTTLGPG